MRRAFVCIVVVMFIGCSTGTEEARFDNPIDPGAPGSLDAPEAVTVTLGDNQVMLAWTMPAGQDPPATRYAVFRRQLGVDETDEHEKIAESADLEYVDRSARNGNVYGYLVAASASGSAFGERSEEVTAAPALFGIVLGNGAEATRSETVGAILTAPNGTVAVQLSEDPEFGGAAFRSFSSTVSHQLSFGDGEKTVYARFRLADGAGTLPVSDAIVLDTRAVVSGVSFDGLDTRAPGESVHFILSAGEAEGEASIGVPGLFSGLPLFDDGTAGDPAAGDGVYERTVEIPGGSSVSDASVTGRFTDRAGNTAAAVDAARTLTVRDRPVPVELLEALTSEPPKAASVTLRWTQSSDAEFSAYRLFRSDDGEVDSTDVVAASSTSRSTVELTDGDIAEGTTYSYRVYVRSSTGLESGSNSVQISVPNLRPPGGLNLNAPDGVGAGSLGLSWRASTDRDFAAYVIRRSEEPVVGHSIPEIARIANIHTTLFFDTGLQENTRYYYRLYVEDAGGLSTPGLEMETRSRNLPPPAVQMTGTSNPDTNAVTVAWEASMAHDFASYRLYRDRGPGVGTFSTLVADIEEIDVTTYRDTELKSGTTYYYRIFVVDDGVVPGPEATGSSNTVNATTQDP